MVEKITSYQVRGLTSNNMLKQTSERIDEYYTIKMSVGLGCCQLYTVAVTFFS